MSWVSWVSWVCVLGVLGCVLGVLDVRILRVLGVLGPLCRNPPRIWSEYAMLPGISGRGGGGCTDNAGPALRDVNFGNPK